MHALSASEEAILKRFAEHELLNAAIDKIIHKYYAVVSGHEKTKCGDVHQTVASELGVPLNRSLHKAVKARIENLGSVPRKVRGYRYYRCLVKKAS